MSYRRTAVALVLTVFAVAVPSAAWFVAGQRQLDREIDLLEKGVYMKAEKTGVVHAGWLAGRFQGLLESESRRPFYHYQNLFHDPEGAAEGASVSVSPLAKGSPDPLIEAHFQVDVDGRLTLPTINDEFPELGLQSTDSAHCAVLEELRDVAYFCFGELDSPVAAAYGEAARAERGGAAEAEAATEVVLSARAWRQHLQASALYADLKYSGKGNAASRMGAAPSDDEVRIEVGPFRWHTLPVGDELGLVALRRVDTPEEKWTQGFVISLEKANELIQTQYPAVFAPLLELEKEERGAQVVHPVAQTQWAVSYDISQSLDETLAEAGADRDRFYTFFLIGAIAAGVAGLLLVAMVFQSERLALQRAQFAASAAHELRTPLAGLRLYGEMLAEGMGNPSKARDYARRMAAEAERLGRVVTNVLSFTRLERKSLSVQPVPGDLAAAVHDAFRRQQPALREAGVEVEIDLPDDLPTALFDRDAVSHIVQNLLDNAEKYTRGVAGRRIEIALVPGSSGVELTVADNGHGISRDMRGRLFQAYARDEEQHDAEGLGLGLVLIKALAKAQGGDIRYRDRPEGGAEFTVTFARPRGAALGASPDRMAEAAGS